jgi:hypothetical protein
MVPKDFWQDKWLNDQLNKRNPGQENHPDNLRKRQDELPPPEPEKEQDAEKKK